MRKKQRLPAPLPLRAKTPQHRLQRLIPMAVAEKHPARAIENFSCLLGLAHVDERQDRGHRIAEGGVNADQIVEHAARQRSRLRAQRQKGRTNPFARHGNSGIRGAKERVQGSARSEQMLDGGRRQRRGDGSEQCSHQRLRQVRQHFPFQEVRKYFPDLGAASRSPGIDQHRPSAGGSEQAIGIGHMGVGRVGIRGSEKEIRVFDEFHQAVGAGREHHPGKLLARARGDYHAPFRPPFHDAGRSQACFERFRRLSIDHQPVGKVRPFALRLEARQEPRLAGSRQRAQPDDGPPALQDFGAQPSESALQKADGNDFGDAHIHRSGILRDSCPRNASRRPGGAPSRTIAPGGCRPRPWTIRTPAARWSSRSCR